MPIKINGKIFESDGNESAFAKAVKYLISKGHSKKSAEAIVGKIEKDMQNAMASEVLPELYSENGKDFAKFFLINSHWNKQDWRVTPESIPENIKTFEGMPFISEPDFEHFGMKPDDPVSQILQTQEKYRIGTMVKTNYNAVADTGEVIVEFDDTPKARKAYKELQNGEAIYVSPSVTGIAEFDMLNRITYNVWHGLHLARVKNPAYGVMVASIKETCSGPKSACINRMFQNAVANGIVPSSSFNTQAQIIDMADQAEEMKTLQDKLTQFSSTVEGLKSENQNLITAKSDLEGKLKSAMASSTDDATKKLLENLSAKVAAYDNKEKEEFAVALADGEVLAEIISKDQHKDRVANYMTLDVDGLKKIYSEKKPLIEKIINMQTAQTKPLFSNNGNRVVHIPQEASAKANASETITSCDQLMELF